VRGRAEMGLRSASAEIELEKGEYEILPKILASRFTDKPSIEDIVKKYADKKPQKLRQIGINHDIANAKGLEKKDMEEMEEMQKEAEAEAEEATSKKKKPGKEKKGKKGKEEKEEKKEGHEKEGDKTKSAEDKTEPKAGEASKPSEIAEDGAKPEVVPTESELMHELQILIPHDTKSLYSK
jgi:hypothetical protein